MRRDMLDKYINVASRNALGISVISHQQTMRTARVTWRHADMHDG
jgi:hypothetical protein